MGVVVVVVVMGVEVELVVDDEVDTELVVRGVVGGQGTVPRGAASMWTRRGGGVGTLEKTFGVVFRPQRQSSTPEAVPMTNIGSAAGELADGECTSFRCSAATQ